MINTKKIFGILTLIAVCAAIVFLTNIPQYLKFKNGDIKDFDSVAAGELQKGDLVRGTIDMTLGPCAEEYTTNYGVRTSSKSNKLYYVVWMNNDNFILYETGNESEYSTLDRLTDETNAYFDSLSAADESGDMADLELPSTTLTLEGVVKETPSSIEDLFREWWDDDSDYESRTERVMVSRAQFDRFGTVVISGIVAAVLAVVFGILFFITRKKGY